MNFGAGEPASKPLQIIRFHAELLLDVRQRASHETPLRTINRTDYGSPKLLRCTSGIIQTVFRHTGKLTASIHACWAWCSFTSNVRVFPPMGNLHVSYYKRRLNRHSSGWTRASKYTSLRLSRRGKNDFIIRHVCDKIHFLDNYDQSCLY